MKGWYVFIRGEYVWAYNRETRQEQRVLVGMHILAETAGQAKSIGASEMEQDFTSVGVHRRPEYDGLTYREMDPLISADNPWELV